MQCELSFQHRIKGLQESYVAARTKCVKDIHICICKDKKCSIFKLSHRIHLGFPSPGPEKEL